MTSSLKSPYMLGLGLGAALSGAIFWIYKNRKTASHMTWVEVGTVDDLMIFPVKSGAGYSVEECRITKFGLSDGTVFDRAFIIMMTSCDPWTHVTHGMAPPLGTIKSSMGNGALTLTPLQGNQMIVDVKKAVETEKLKFNVKGQPSSGFDCGDEVASWLQKELYPNFFNGKIPGKSSPPKIRLMYVGNPEELKRPARIPPVYHFPQFKKEDMQIYHDSCAYHLFTRQSFDDFNSKLDRQMPLGQMRPNIVVNAHQPYEEDNWAYVKIGEDIQLRTLKPRETCERINVRPDTGERQKEVLDTLKTFRVPSNLPHELKSFWSKKPLFGLHLGLDQGGKIQVGDKVWAVLAKPHWLL